MASTATPTGNAADEAAAANGSSSGRRKDFKSNRGNDKRGAYGNKRKRGGFGSRK
jgi:hypothetical protein